VWWTCALEVPSTGLRSYYGSKTDTKLTSQKHFTAQRINIFIFLWAFPTFVSLVVSILGFRGNLFSVILFTYPNHRNRFSSLTSNMIFSTCIIARMVLYGKVMFLDFLAGLLQKSIPVASSLLDCCVFAVYVSAVGNTIIWIDAL
jgi:hypothetical protein